MARLVKVEVEGFKSIRDVKLTLGPINVLIGANGSGKSNFISLLSMLNYIITEGLQVYVGRAGGANSLLYYGAKNTPQMIATITFKTKTGKSVYHMRLADAAPDTLIFLDETVTFQRPGHSRPKKVLVGSGNKETLLNETADKKKDQTVKVIRNILRKCQVFQFHDTSESANIRREGPLQHNFFLYKDAGNLAAYLYMLEKKQQGHYERIVETIRLAAPHFQEFNLKPSKLNPNYIMLNWKEKGSDYPFGPHQISDGLIRFMALATLLLQPKYNLPDVIIIDEPELGLHPSAMNILGAMIREASNQCQIILATQSTNLVDQFDAKDIVILERKKINERKEFSSKIIRPDPTNLKDWLEEYTLGQVWEKNLMGGRP